MFRPVRSTALRSLPSSSQLARQSQRHQRRLITFTPPAHKSRSFKSGIARWALAAGGLYWYTTRDVDIFAEDARSRLSAKQRIEPTYEETEELPTVETITTARRERRETTARDTKPSEPPPPPSADKPSSPSNESSTLASTNSAAQSTTGPSSVPPETISKEHQIAAQPISTETSAPDATAPGPASAGSLEEEAEAEGAFNEETGEINWDCPCLGGMAHGPCGEQFRDAFSCFVFSKEEPKGIDCIDRFKTMQECFRQHPDVYGAELRESEPESDEDHNAALEDDASPLHGDSEAASPNHTKAAPVESQANYPASPSSSSTEPQKSSEQAKAENKA